MQLLSLCGNVQISNLNVKCENRPTARWPYFNTKPTTGCNVLCIMLSIKADEIVVINFVTVVLIRSL